MPIHEGPYLSAALLCDRVLEEKDGTKSAIRVIDRLTHNVFEPNPPANMEPFDHKLTLFIRFKSGHARGIYSLKMNFVTPAGESSARTVNVNFEGEEDRGVDIIAPMQMRIEMQGIYWVEIFLGDDFMTRIPLRVVYIPQITQQTPLGGPGS